MASPNADLLGATRGRRALAGSFVASIALPASALITGPIFARTIGAAGRGEATAATAPLILAVSLIAGGLYSGSVFYVSKNRDHTASVLRSGYRLAFWGGAVLALSLFTLAPVLARQSPDLIVLIRVCALAAPLIIAGRVARGVAMARGEYRFVYGTTVVSAAARAGVVIAAAWSDRLDVTMAILVLVGYEVVPSLAMIAKNLGPLSSGDEDRVGPTLRDYGRYSGAAAAGSATASLTTRLDLVVLAPLVAPSDLGAYVFAFGLTNIWTSVVRSFAATALPEVSRTGDHESVAVLCRLLVCASVVIVAVTIAAGPSIVRVVYGDGFGDTARLLPLLMVGSSIFALEHIPGTILLAAGAPRERSFAQIIGAVITVVGLAVAAPTWGVWGAAVVSALAYFATALITLHLTWRTVGQPWTDFVVPRRSDLAVVGAATADIRARWRS